MDIPLSAPEGFRWHQHNTVQAMVLIPTDWVVREMPQTNAPGMMACLPSYDGRRDCHGALSMNVINNVSLKFGMSASAYGKKSMVQVRTRHRVLQEKEHAPDEGMQSWFIRFRSVLSPTPRIVHRYMLAEDACDRLRWCTFEASESLWPQASPVGRVIFNHLIMQFPVDDMLPADASLH
ncbi:hypothetical protein [Dyella sp. ASV21]|uniref:hypothetical protein n=1 Tax=Dyella sp. ASV21 TaxID=2795114 RepID=UPI0018EC6D66|nr:hypothetical protein [Dyella sp. ASV21]